jgi:integrase/recombinase XerD
VFATYETGNAGQPLDPRYVRAALTRYGTRAGVEKRCHPHGLRHSLAFDLAQRGILMHAIQAGDLSPRNPRCHRRATDPED